MSKKLTLVDVYTRTSELIFQVRTTDITPAAARRSLLALSKRAAGIGVVLQVPSLEELKALIPVAPVAPVEPVSESGFVSSEEENASGFVDFEESYEESYESSYC